MLAMRPYTEVSDTFTKWLAPVLLFLRYVFFSHPFMALIVAFVGFQHPAQPGDHGHGHQAEMLESVHG